MMKKLLSTFLCILMIISMLAVPVSAFVDLDDPNVTWNDRSALKLESPLHANHPVYIPFGKKDHAPPSKRDPAADKLRVKKACKMEKGLL